MIKYLNKFAGIALATSVTLAAGAASAATLSVVGGTSVSFNTAANNYDSTCEAGAASCFNPNGVAGSLMEDLQVFTADDAYPGLTINEAGRIRVSFLGKEARAVNAATTFAMGGKLVSTTDMIGTSYTANVAPVAVDFTFISSLGSSAGFGGFAGNAAIGFSDVFNNGKSVYAFFDDSGADVDRDFDDMVVKIDVVPLPASALLLLGGLGLLGGMRRRQSA